MIDNQKGRRNITDGWKFELAQLKKGMLAERAKQRQGQRTDILSNVDKRFDSHDTRSEIAAEIGVSGKTYDALRKVSNDGTDELKQAVRENKVGASTAAEIAQLPVETQREIASLPTRKEIVEETKKHHGLVIRHSRSGECQNLTSSSTGIISTANTGANI